MRVTMASCFDARTLSVQSLDVLPIAAPPPKKKPFSLGRLFRSKSDTAVKVEAGAKPSPRTSPRSGSGQSGGAAPRRRFMRVLHDGEQAGEEYANPHVLRKYRPGYWEQHMQAESAEAAAEAATAARSASLEEVRSGHSTPPAAPGTGAFPALPYTVTGRTILKKQHHYSVESMEDRASTPPQGSPCDVTRTEHLQDEAAPAVRAGAVVSETGAQLHKHASFNEDVEVFEYDVRGWCKLVFHEKIQYDVCDDSAETQGLSDMPRLVFDPARYRDTYPGRRATSPDTDTGDYEVESALGSPLPVIDEDGATTPDDNDLTDLSLPESRLCADTAALCASSCNHDNSNMGSPSSNQLELNDNAHAQLSDVITHKTVVMATDTSDCALPCFSESQ